MKIGKKEFEDNKTYVMGILNVTPDSFSDGGNFLTVEDALYRVKEMVAEGAAVIDIGGESTRPGYTMISDAEEIARVCPVITAIKKEFDIPISLDTYKAAVAKEGIACGADMINDIWGLMHEENMGQVIADAKVSYCLMHNRRETNAMLDISDFLKQMEDDLQRAEACGIARERIIYDPGIGFAKTQEQNLELIGNLDKFVSGGVPILLGASRKSVIRYVLDLPVEERLEGTLATTAEAVLAGVSFVRVHDVKENVRFIKMLERMREKRVR